MNKALDNIITEVDANLTYVQINFDDNAWGNSIPAQAGWYLITTNMPINELRAIAPPQHKAHINIPRAIHNVSSLNEVGIAIRQFENEHYVVYNGEAGNLKSRAREHVYGHPKTYCLGLSKYDVLSQYEWRFYYTLISSCQGITREDKSLRLAVEQGWRAKHGWPVLCSK